MDQRSAGERRRGGAPGRRGHATTTTGPRTATPYRRPLAPRAEPMPVARPGRHRSPWGRSGRILPIRWGRIVAGCAVALALAGGIVAFALVSSHRDVVDRQATGTRSPDEQRVTLGAVPSAPSPTVTRASSSGSASPTPGSHLAVPSEVPVPPAPTGTPPTERLASAQPGPRAAGPVLTISRHTVDLGSVDSTDTVDLANTGSEALTVRIGALPPWLTATVRADSVDPGYQTQLVLTLDRSAAPVGQIDVQVPVAPATGIGGGSVRVTALVSGGPRILSVTPPALAAASCATATAPSAPTTGLLSVTVQDPVGMSGGTVTVTAPDGATSVQALRLDDTDGDQSTWSGPFGPSEAGSLSYTVTVKDLNSRSATRQGTATVAACAS